MPNPPVDKAKNNFSLNTAKTFFDTKFSSVLFIVILPI